jgi:acyl-CoA thioesterase-1
LSLGATEENLRSIIKSARGVNAKVVLLGMQIPPNYGADYAQKFSGMYPRLARETGAVLVPFFLDKIVSTPAMFQADRLHPTADAQPILLDSVWPYLKPILRN